jgi:penicillin amidase
MTRPLRWLLRLVAVIVLAAALCAGLLYWRLWSALPGTDGTVRVAGPTKRVQILRDRDRVVHVRGESEADALFGLGYAHAQDRLWQMEFQRRTVQGRLSEILGEPTVGTDRFLRTLGIARAARAAWPNIQQPARGLVEAYVAGVNAFLESHRGRRLPIEFLVLRVAPEPWTPEDVIGWGKLMAWSLSLNWREELLRVRLTAKVGADAAAALMPAYAVDGPIVAPDSSVAPPDRNPATTATGLDAARSTILVNVAAALDGLAVQPAMPPTGGGSNNWVVGGSRSATSKPLLANDPHLAAQAPALWYLAHVTGGRLDAIGATLPGAPGIIIGHNRRIAWGVTNLMADVQDFYVEHINQRDQYEYDAAWQPMQVIRDVIKVKGGSDVPIRIRVTRHGPLLSDVLDETGQALALRWTGLDAADRTAEAFLHLNLASSWDEFLAALQRFHAPMQNFVYADVDGNIGYHSPGALPMRPRGNGTTPMPGWISDADWSGYVPASGLPRLFNPPRGFIASANNQTVPDGFPYLVSTSWEAPYRARRIEELIQAKARLTVDDMADMQRDVQSAQVSRVLPFLLRAHPNDDAGRQAIDRLRRWNGALKPESSEAVIYKAWYARALERLLVDDLGIPLAADYIRSPSTAAKALDRMIQTLDVSWCDDVRTSGRETCETLLGGALAEALVDMTAVQGTNDVGAWRWDRLNRAPFRHQPFNAIRALRPFFSREVARGGDAFTLAANMPIRDDVFISSYRQLIDLADLDRSRFMIPMGQSGQILSGHYSDLLDPWQRVAYLPMRFTRAAVDAAVTDRLILEPASR